MDIYATREELKSRQKNIFDLKLNVAYYARVSTDKEEQKTSIEHQWTFFEQLISDVKNWTLVDGYIDEGISGITVTHREEFQRMLQDAKAGKNDLGTQAVNYVRYCTGRKQKTFKSCAFRSCKIHTERCGSW